MFSFLGEGGIQNRVGERSLEWMGGPWGLTLTPVLRGNGALVQGNQRSFGGPQLRGTDFFKAVGESQIQITAKHASPEF